MIGDLLDGYRVLAFDLETTGISTRRDRIVQIALVGADEDGQQIHYDEIVNPGIPIPFEASNVHGIFDADVRGKEKFKDILSTVHELIDGAVIIGHNVLKFDLPFIEQEYFRCGELPPKPAFVIDTLLLARRLKVGRPHNLGSLCSRHGIDLTNAHTAGADAAASMLLFAQLAKQQPKAFRRPIADVEQWIIHGGVKSDASELGRGLQDLDSLDENGKIKIDEEEFIIAFGRYRGTTVRSLYANDVGYFNWLISDKGLACSQTASRLKEHVGLD
ncbi:MAG: 3'-5' exonuclease [Candidatus Thermoplasmatota archaeon]|nr:3'-5' exonuclease [Candidatus Thermoplasmatota archaeon]